MEMQTSKLHHTVTLANIVQNLPYYQVIKEDATDKDTEDSQRTASHDAGVC